MSGMNTACLRCGEEVANEAEATTGRLCRNCPGVVCEGCAEGGQRCPQCNAELRDTPGFLNDS